MNVQRFRKLCSCKYFYNAQRYRSTQVKSESEIELLPKQEARVSQIANGIKVASIEDNSPLTHVTVAVKAGSRYENPKENLGIAHCLRNAAVLTSKNHTAFSLTRNLEIRGAKLSVTGSRDNLFYTLICPRDEVDPCLELLSEVTNKQVFKPWEVSDQTSNLQVDVAMLNHQPHAVLNELLHKAAFRGGLSNSLYSPPWMIGKHSCEMLHNYIQDNFTTSRTSVVALGISHDHLQSCVNGLFELSDRSATSSTGVSKFAPGEVRQEANIAQVHVAIVAEGAGLNNSKEVLSLGVLESILGGGSEINLCAPTFTKLGAAAAKSTKDPFYVSSLNVNYADTGIFGLYVVGSPNAMNDLVKAVVGEMKQIAKSVTDSAVEIAKYKLKAKLLLDRELSSNFLNTMAVEVSEMGQIRDVNDLLKSIDALKTSDIQTVAGRVVKAKPAMAALGNLHSTPHVDELI